MTFALGCVSPPKVVGSDPTSGRREDVPPYIADALSTLAFFAYYAACAAAIMLLTERTGIPPEVARKAYHLMCSASIFIVLFAFQRWWAAASAVAGFFLVAYLATWLLERIPAFRFIRRRNQGPEIRRQIISVLAVFVLLIVLFWGVLGPGSRVHAAVGLAAWGVGDAVAGMCGKRFGRVRSWFSAFAPKTLEGTVAMFGAALLAIFLTLTFLTPVPLVARLVASTILALAASLIELVTRRGWDTLSVPAAVALLSFLILPAVTRMMQYLP